MEIFNAKFNKWKSRGIVAVSIIKFDSFPLLYNELHMHRICVNVGNSSKASLYEISVHFFFFFFFFFKFSTIPAGKPRRTSNST